MSATPDEGSERLAALVAAIPDPIYRIRPDGTFVSVEVPDDHPTAVPQDSIPGQNLRDVMPRRQADIIMGGLERAIATGGLVAVEYDFTIEGEKRFWEARLVPADGDVFAIVREITERRRSEAETLRRARTDPLTGLANRSAFDDLLLRAVARSHRTDAHLALLYLDLDRFKAVNDDYGHATGDAVLEEVAGRVTGVLRDVDVAARLGGDEIAVVLEGVPDPRSAEVVAQRLVEAVSAPYVVDGREHRIGLSVGIALLDDELTTPEDLVAAADRAMYVAKRTGEGGVAVSGAGTREAWGGPLSRRARPAPGRAGSG